MREELKMPEDFVVRFLDHAVFDGWGRRALNAAAQDVGLEKISVRRGAPNGPRDMVLAFNDMANARMIEALAKVNINHLPVRERIGTAIRVRLQQNDVHKEAVRKMLSYLAFPGRAALAGRCAYETVDTMWRIAGDTSTDFNFYTKRGLLLGVYGSTVLYWLSDLSEDQKDTWDFLERRIADVMTIPKIQSAIKKGVSRMPSPGRLLKLRAREG